MKLKHPLRVMGRGLWLLAELVLAAVRYGLECGFRKRDQFPARRAHWLRACATRMLRTLNIHARYHGRIPAEGLLVCNHLSYIDILVLAASTEAVFVAKSDLKHWPVLGWFARLAGTVFVERERRARTGRSVDEIKAALQTGVLLVLFPEGTSSSGETVLPFKSSLLEPAVRTTYAVTAGLIEYELEDGDVSEEVCYWKDMTLFPHLLNLLSKRVVFASVRFAAVPRHDVGRKELARRLHGQILGMKQASMPPRGNLQHCSLRPTAA